MELGDRLEHHDRCWLHLWLSLITVHHGGRGTVITGGCCWGPAWGYGYGGYASTNVYGRWGNTAYAHTGAAWASPYSGNYGDANRTSFQNTQRGTMGVVGGGTNTNIYTGNTYGGRGAVGYNPNTGIVAGAGAGYSGNIYTGQGEAGRGGFAYNTNTGAGIAAGGNNIYAGKDGNVYRYDRQNGNWSQNSGSGWKSTSRPEPRMQQQRARAAGQQRSTEFQRCDRCQSSRRRPKKVVNPL